MTTVETLKDFFVQSGAGWVLWLLFVLSVGSIAVAVERFWFFSKKSGNLQSLIGSLDEHLRSGDRGAALTMLASSQAVGAAVATAGLKLASRGAKSADKGMQGAMAVERKLLERRLSYLGTLGNNAPFIGLFGTVIGVILAFEALGHADAAAGSGQMASSEVMSAIAEALVATAVGIGVALPAVVLNNYFYRRIADLMADAEALASMVVAYMVQEEGDSEQETSIAEATGKSTGGGVKIKAPTGEQPAPGAA